MLKRSRWVLLSASFALAIIISLLLFSSPSQAVMLKIGMQKLATGADSIIIGTVVESTSQWNADHTRIETSVVMTVEETLKGAPLNTVTITVPGGEVGDRKQWVSDVPRFQVGERAVVFLKQNAGKTEVYGYFQGKYTIDRDRVESKPLSDFKGRINRAIHGIRAPDGVELADEPEYFDTPPLTGNLPAASLQTPLVRADGWQTIMSENFEGNFPGTQWTLGGNPTWGKDTYNSYSGSSVWCARGGTLGVSPGQYPNNVNSWMIFGPFNLSDANDADLTLMRWVQTEAANDYFGIYTSIDGYWYYGERVSGSYGSWTQHTLSLRNNPLGNICGQPAVWIALVFKSNATVQNTGAFVDNIVLRKYVSSAVTITSINPPSASAGTGSRITITGTGFGSTPGTVNFFYKSGQPYITSTPGNGIISWTDTSIVTTVPVGIIGGYMASAGSGPVYVHTAAGLDSPQYPFTVTFSYGGYEWAGSNPTVNYYVNENNLDDPGEGSAVQFAASTWNGVSDKSFSLHYAGASSATQATQNGQNEVMWKDLFSTGPLAQAWCSFTGNTLIECDIEFNEFFIWSAVGTPLVGAYDIQSVAIHEMGHWLNLRDLYGYFDSQKIMYGIGSSGTTKRDLHADDKAGIRWIYPPTTLSVVTNDVTNVGTSTARLNGDLTSLGGEASANVSLQWGTVSGSPTETPPSGKTTIGTYYYDLGGLTLGTKYFYRAKASGGSTVYGAEKSFTAGVRIPFVSDRDGNSEIYIMNPDGTGQTRLTSYSYSDYTPSLSPDGSKIAYTSTRGSNDEIYVMNADGTDQTWLTNNPARDYYPAWSPDGTKLAFVSNRDGNTEIYVMNADGSNQTRLTNNTAFDLSPEWSPDGAKIAFVSDRDNNYEIYVMNVDGGSVTRLTFRSSTDTMPVWSPDGAKIAFMSTREGNPEIFVMNTNGGNQTRLTNNTATDSQPLWLADGRIAFTSTRTGNPEVFIMNADGGNQISISGNMADDVTRWWESPLLRTDNADNIISTSARLNGYLTSLGEASSVNVTFQWGNAPGSYPSESTITPAYSPGTFSYDLSGLTAGVTYYYRMKTVGDSTSYGTEKGFVAGSTPPTVATNDASDFTLTGARLNGNLTATGSTGTATASFLWGLYPGDYINETTPATTPVGTFSFDITGLQPGTTYYYKAKAVGGSTSYGLEKSFTALQVARILGETWEVKGLILGDVTLTLDGSTSVVSSAQGAYELTITSTGTHTIVAGKDAFRNQPLTVDVTDLAGTYTLNFKANNGLVPKSADLNYVLACINKWKFPVEDLGLNLTKVLAVINAWKIPAP